MRHRLSLLALALSTAVAAPAALARDNLAKFEGAIGVHPVGGNSAAGAATTINTVRGVAPGGRPWGILSFKATIKQDGSIRAKGEGLVLSGTDAAGSRGGVRQVAVTLYCGSNVGFNSQAVELTVGGDFEIRGALDAMPPAPCGDETTPPTLLIRNATGGALGAWFAVGVVDD